MTGPDPRRLLLAALRAIDSLRALDLREWDLLLRAARYAHLLPQLAVRAADAGVIDGVPAPVRPALEAACVLAARNQVVVGWEIDRIGQALRAVDTPVVLLKGAAYQAIALSTAPGRPTSDVDILVPRETLPAVEAALRVAGWEAAPLDPRDQAYFRRWMHELPPLQHARRRTMIDVHYTIVPPTDRLHVDPRLLLEAAVAAPGSGLRVLGPVDMLLHSAAHLFRNGAWSHALRDLVDMDALVRRFGTEPGFWDDVQARARQLDLAFPAGAALRALPRYLDTPIPEPIRRAHAASRLGLVLDGLADRAVLPRTFEGADTRCERARTLLSYWPLPRVRAMATPLFWIKRLPRTHAPSPRPAADAQGPVRPDREA